MNPVLVMEMHRKIAIGASLLVIDKKQTRDSLIIVLNQTRELLALAENDFSWSSWNDMSDALDEIDGYLSALHSGKTPSILEIQTLFLPTSPLQEVSISSGWGRQFLELAKQFDDVIAKAI